MRWQRGRRSTNVEDQRGRRLSSGKKVGGLGTLVLVLVALYFGIDPGVILDQGVPTGMSTGERPAVSTPGTSGFENDPLAEFVSVVLADTEDTWRALFARTGKPYRDPTLVLFSGAVESACGFAESAVGPFYCPRDQKVYIDLSFYRDLKNRHQAPGDFAQAYVIAHEIGHHVQTLLGISQQVHAARSRAGREEGNRLSVKMELQADCLAGIWAHHADRARQILEAGDIEEALNAASAIGDDRLQRQARGYVSPESFTHGSSAQRVGWFKRGLQSGNPDQCNTFEEL